MAASRLCVVIPSLQRRTRRRRRNCGLNCNDIGSIPVLGFLGKLRTPHVPPNDLAGGEMHRRDGLWVDGVICFCKYDLVLAQTGGVTHPGRVSVCIAGSAW